MNLKLDTLAPTQIYHLMAQTVVPRPIALALDPLSRLVGGEYATLSNVFSVARPK